MSESKEISVVELSPWKFLAGCSALSLVLLGIGGSRALPPGLIGAEVFLTVIALFVFGSIRYRLDKNALTYGAGLVIGATFWTSWWKSSGLRQAVEREGPQALWEFIRHHLLTLHGLDRLIHADTMLFILGLTFFVSVIAQTRLLESVSFRLLDKMKGNVVPTVAALAALVSFSSGILDGVSMIGLMIRTMVIILFLSKTNDESVVFAVIVSTVVTTVCGMWLAYGEPPNLIMKANLHPHLNDAFFLRYCLPAAVGSYFIVFWNIRRRLRGRRVEAKSLDVLDRHTADVRFLQAYRHGEALTYLEFVEDHRDLLGSYFEPLLARIHKGEPLGVALVKENVPEEKRKQLLGVIVAEDLAEILDHHYRHVVQENNQGADEAADKVEKILEWVRRQRTRAQWVGIASFLPFIGLLVAHAVNHRIPLFWASFAGFAVAVTGIWSFPKMRKLALHEGLQEYKEYLFLLPLFFSITLLQKTGFFQELSVLLQRGIETMGASHVAFIQFTGAVFLSAILDNNVVADFAARALHGLDVGLIHLFAMAQIAGYAAGGCWTHIGSAQSVVAYAFIRKEVDERFTPFQWIKVMTPVILEIFVLMAGVVYIEGWIMRHWG
jgi:Na+/H+ antiporter NhaD/arsenite permease-like protein